MASWSTPPSWEPGADGIPDGVGKYLIKVHDRDGVPVKNKLMPSEISHTNTAQKWSAPVAVGAA
jgi:hypothetical protein